MNVKSEKTNGSPLPKTILEVQPYFKSYYHKNIFLRPRCDHDD